METHSGEGVMKEKFPNSRKPSQRQVCGENKQTNKQNPQNRRLTATASGEVAQRLASATSKRGLDREAQATGSVLRVRTKPEYPKDNLRELT